MPTATSSDCGQWQPAYFQLGGMRGAEGGERGAGGVGGAIGWEVHCSQAQQNERAREKKLHFSSHGIRPY